MSILKQLFDGDYYPSEQITPKSQEYAEKRAACNMAQTELEKALGNDDDPNLTKFLDAYADVVDMMNYEFFKEGIRFGMELMKELQETDMKEAIDV